MKQIKILGVLSALILTFSTLHAETKRYDVKSGVIEYKTTGSGDMMGIKTEMSGTNKVMFKEWGKTELHQSTTKSVVMGREENTQDTTKIENGKVYVVDYVQKIIIEYDASKLMHSQYKDLAKSSKELLTDMGGKKVGEESILGYECEVWKTPMIKLWVYKGLALKSEATVMGITNTMEATNVQLDVSVSDEDLKLPDFPLKTMQEAHTPSEMPQMTPEQMQQMQEMMKSFTQK
jgi:hypothetical protein